MKQISRDVEEFFREYEGYANGDGVAEEESQQFAEVFMAADSEGGRNGSSGGFDEGGCDEAKDAGRGWETSDETGFFGGEAAWGLVRFGGDQVGDGV
jgi:hypothetical protein